MSNSTTIPTQYYVTFDRIGRTHNPPPLLVQTDDLSALAQAIHEHADTMLMSRDTRVHVEEDGGIVIFAGFHVGGSGEYRAVATLCRDENCPTCGHPETNSIVPMVDGGILPELLAIHCRRCGGFFVEADTVAVAR